MTGKVLFTAITLWAFRFLLAGIFLYAGVGKLLDPIRFLTVVRGYDILPDPWAAWFAMGLPWLEILTAVVMLTPWMALGGSLVASGLVLTFIAALLSAWARGMAIDCGCFGGGGDPVTSYLDVISLRVVLLGISAVAFCLLWKEERHRKAPC